MASFAKLEFVVLRTFAKHHSQNIVKMLKEVFANGQLEKMVAVEDFVVIPTAKIVDTKVEGFAKRVIERNVFGDSSKQKKTNYVPKEFAVLEESANLFSKKMCTHPTTEFKKWSPIRKGRCRKQFECKKNNKGKIHCKFTGKTICLKVRRTINPKAKCLFKRDIKANLKHKNKECSIRVCCRGNKCKSMAHICVKKSKLVNGCKMHFLGRGRCKQQLCCVNGNCHYKGKKICKYIPDRKIYYPKGKLCLFHRRRVNNGKLTCIRRMCCNHKRCVFKTKEVCYVIKRNFCTRVFIRNGKCVSRYCCSKNSKGKYNCSARGKKHVSLEEKYH